MTFSSRLALAGCLLLSGTAMAFAPHQHDHSGQQHFTGQKFFVGQKVVRAESKSSTSAITGPNLAGRILDDDATLDDYLTVIHDYINAHDELGFTVDDLVLNSKAVLMDDDVQFFKFHVYRDRVLVLDANVDFRFKRGSLIEIINQSFSEAVSDTRPTAANMFAATRAQLGTSALHAAGKVYRVVETASGYQLVRVQRYEFEHAATPYTSQVEEATAAIFEAHPIAHYLNGIATAEVHARTWQEPLATTPMAALTLVDTASRTNIFTAGDGTFTTDNSKKFGLNGFTGKQIRVTVAKGSPLKVTGDLQDERWVVAARKNSNAEAHADDEIAQAMVYHHGNAIVDYARRFIHTRWFDTPLLANVNLSSTCNAYWNGRSINFFSAGRNGNTQCANTGLVADVVYHEWGHGLDHNTGGIQDRAYSEGFGDIVSLLMTRSNLVGPGFKVDGGFVRDLEPDKIYPRDKGEEHAEGLIIGSTFYDLYLALQEQFGDDDAAITKLSEYAFKSIFTASKYTDVYRALLIIDDDDSDPSNGTPNFCVLNSVFTAHGLATAAPECEKEEVH